MHAVRTVESIGEVNPDVDPAVEAVFTAGQTAMDGAKSILGEAETARAIDAAAETGDFTAPGSISASAVSAVIAAYDRGARPRFHNNCLDVDV